MINDSCICNHKEISNLESKKINNKDIIYALCSNCATYRMVSPPSLEEITQYYNNEKAIRLSDSFKSGRNKTSTENIKYIKEYCSTQNFFGKKLLDIGCSEGEFVKVASNSNFESFGIDIATEIVQEGKKQGINIEVGEFLNYTVSNIDIITMHDSLEHVYKPREYLEKAYATLNNIGILQITFPSYAYADSIKNWEHARLDHNWLFSINSLINVLKDIGFRNIVINDFKHGAYYSCVMILCKKEIN